MDLKQRIAKKAELTKKIMVIYEKPGSKRSDSEKKEYEKLCAERKENNDKIKELKVQAKPSKVKAEKPEKVEKPEKAEQKEEAPKKEAKAKEKKAAKNEQAEDIAEETEGEVVGDVDDDKKKSKDDADDEDGDEDDKDDDF